MVDLPSDGELVWVQKHPGVTKVENINLVNNSIVLRMKNTKKGFTLIELLIVIGILAILVAAVVVVLNPAQLLAQARDGQRMSDMDSLRSAINFYLASATSTNFLVSVSSSAATSTWTASPNNPPTSTLDAIYFNNSTTPVVSSTLVTGTGWVPINFSALSGGSPLAKLPIDPTNSGNYVYGFAGSNASSTYKIITRLESTKYAPKMSADGGNLNDCGSYTNANCWYEVGSDVTGL